MPFSIEIGQVVLEKKIFKFLQCIFAILSLSPIGKGGGPSFEQTCILFTQGCIVLSLVEIGSLALENKILNFVNVILSPFRKGARPFI